MLVPDPVPAWPPAAAATIRSRGAISPGARMSGLARPSRVVPRPE
jgi:hypothetical protein